MRVAGEVDLVDSDKTLETKKKPESVVNDADRGDNGDGGYDEDDENTNSQGNKKQNEDDHRQNPHFLLVNLVMALKTFTRLGILAKK